MPQQPRPVLRAEPKAHAQETNLPIRQTKPRGGPIPARRAALCPSPSPSRCASARPSQRANGAPESTAAAPEIAIKLPTCGLFAPPQDGLTIRHQTVSLVDHGEREFQDRTRTAYPLFELHERAEPEELSLKIASSRLHFGLRRLVTAPPGNSPFRSFPALGQACRQQIRHRP